METLTKPDLQSALKQQSNAAWVVLNNFVTENQKPLEFRKHRSLIDPLEDEHDDIVGRKSAQVGWSVINILKAVKQCMKGRNVGYVLPSQNIVKDFVTPKVDPLLTGNPEIAKLITKDSVTLKQIGDRFLYFRGAFSEREAIAISLDVLILDELDRMPDMNIVNTYDSRLQASEFAYRWRFSNPSAIGFGVDALYQDSDQRHWFITCHHCNHEWFIDFERNDQEKSHYVDKQKVAYACGKCHKDISDADRQNGRWVEKYPSRYRHGYWVSQLMMPFVSAAKVIEQYEESSIEFFYNFVLGKAYTPSDMLVDRAAILRACAPSNITKTHVAIGVDQDAGGQYFIAMTTQGVFAHGYVDSWDEIEHLKLMYKAVVVCDPNPYSAIPKQLANKYNDWYLCYFKNLDSLSAVQWKEKEQVVYADRTRAIDIVANEIVNGRLLFRERPSQLEDIIAHWNNIYRTTEEKEDGKVKSVWMKKENKQSDYPFAMTYARIGLTQLMGGESTFLEPQREPESQVTNITAKDGKVSVDFSEIINETYSEMES